MRNIWITILISFMAAVGCKNDDKAILREEFKISRNAAMNKEIAKLKGELKRAVTPKEKSVIHSKLATIHAEKGNVVATMKEAKEAVTLDPENFQSRYALGRALLDMGRFQDAETEFSKAIELKADSADTYFQLGNVHYKKLNYVKAIEEYQKTLSLEANHIMALNNLGVLSHLTGRYRDSEKHFRRLIGVKPDYAPAHKNLGIIYDTKLKKRGAAVNHYRRYLTLRPDCPERKLVELWIQNLGG